MSGAPNKRSDAYNALFSRPVPPTQARNELPYGQSYPGNYSTQSRVPAYAQEQRYYNPYSPLPSSQQRNYALE